MPFYLWNLVVLDKSSVAAQYLGVPKLGYCHVFHESREADFVSDFDEFVFHGHFVSQIIEKLNLELVLFLIGHVWILF